MSDKKPRRLRYFIATDPAVPSGNLSCQVEGWVRSDGPKPQPPHPTDPKAILE